MRDKLVKVAASVLSADFMHLADEIGRAEAGGADMIHLDVMDGRFVPNMTVGPMIVRAARKVTRLPVDVHLMVTDPAWFIRELRGSGVDMISVHQEATPHLHRLLGSIREEGSKVGVALNPGTPFKVLKYVLNAIDYLLVMTVNPGFGGQEFIPSTLRKVEEASRGFELFGLDAEIEVDGGINGQTAPKVIGAGANILVAGASLFEAEDLSAAIASLRGASHASADLRKNR